MTLRIGLLAKRIMDVTIASMMLMVLLPFMALIALAIKLDSPGSAIFRQRRAGSQGRLFDVYKFRSMVMDADRTGPVTSLADHRVTRVGRSLRLTSLDELPQLINVLRGEMSLVGPRPLLPESLGPEDAWRGTVKPGCTSLPIVSGRQSLDWDERMQLDLWYVEHWSLWLDLRILLKTFVVVLSRRNVYNKQGQMPPRPKQPPVDSYGERASQ